jgi:hypothetical protein
VKIRLYVCCSYSETVINPLPGLPRLVKTENISVCMFVCVCVCVTMNCKV